MSLGYDIAELPDGLEIRGVTRPELIEALDLLALARTVQADHAETSRKNLLRALMKRGGDRTSTAIFAQAQKLADHRNALLATPFHTYSTLRQQRGDSLESNTRTWVARRRENHELFTVTYQGRTLIPQFQFNDHGELRHELQPLLSVLAERNMDGWSLWTWLTAPTSFLSGAVPEKIAVTDPARALRAAHRFTTSASA